MQPRRTPGLRVFILPRNLSLALVPLTKRRSQDRLLPQRLGMAFGAARAPAARESPRTALPHSPSR